MADERGGGRDQGDARRERVARALRDNLRRRKAQARGRAEAPETAEPPPERPRGDETR